MGLAPFHTWLPDAHSQAPSAVSALLSGALLNCAFLGILRVYQICSAAGLKLFCQEIFIFFGILSILTATVFILNQKNYKRMLAYSSIEHMGIILLGTGLGSWAVYGAFINMTAHSFTKAGLFLTSGNILSWFKTNKISRVTGILEKMPDATGILWLLGFLLITGTPPSGIFTGKFLILKQALFTGNNLTALLFLSGLALIFIGMARSFIFMAMGNKNDGSLENLKNNLISDSKDDLKDNSEDDLINRHNKKTGFTRIVIPLLFFLSALGLGLFMPDSVNLVITAACRAAGGCE
jgi:hydrogenase-4 component F